MIKLSYFYNFLNKEKLPEIWKFYSRISLLTSTELSILTITDQ